jgi:putative Ig domain-containing protein
MRISLCTLIILTAAGCSSGGSDTSTNVTPAPSNSAPIITGSPPLQVTEGQPYSFTPTASDADGDVLTFSIDKPPSWASFDPATGSLTGTPEATDIGTSPGVTISVSDGSNSASLAPFDLEVQSIRLGSATVSWDIPTTNADGSDLDDLAGFNIHYSLASGTFSGTEIINDNTAMSFVITDLQPGTWYFAVSAFDSAGNRSALSAEENKVISP